MNHDIVIFAEQRDGALQKISYELIQGAGKLAEQSGGRVIAVLPGFQIAGAAKKAAFAGADEVIVIDHPALADYLAAPYTRAVAHAIRLLAPETVLFGSTTIGMELAPLVAERFGAGLVTDCTELTIDTENGLLLMTRPSIDGISVDTFVSEIIRPQMATVRPGVLGGSQKEQKTVPQKIPDVERPRGTEAFHRTKPPYGAETCRGTEPPYGAKACHGTEALPSAAPRIRFLDLDFSLDSNGVRIISTDRSRKKNTDITQARILIAGGRGIGGPDGFKTLRAIAELLGGEIACSRACVEAGWIDSSPQVGQTGKTVRPDLYLACGISGAFQHVTGMEGSSLIISINKNPSAPIFDISDLGIVGSIEVILPRLIEALKEYKSV